MKISVNVLKNSKIFMETLEKLMKTKELDTKEKWKLYDVIKACNDGLKKTDEIINALIEKYATDKDEDKTWIDQNKMKQEDKIELNKEYVSIMNNDIELPINEKIKLNEKSIENFTVEELIILSDIIER